MKSTSNHIVALVKSPERMMTLCDISDPLPAYDKRLIDDMEVLQWDWLRRNISTLMTEDLCDIETI